MLVHALDGHADRGLMYAEVCFETFRVTDGAVFCWDAHMARLRHGLAAFGLLLDDKMTASLHTACLKAAARQGRDVLLRLTVTGGNAAWGITPPAKRVLNAWIQAKPFDEVKHPLRLRAVNWPWPVKPRPAKFTSDYAETLRAMQMCRTGEGEAPLFCTGGRVLSTATANILLCRDGAWWTPGSEMDGILPGVVRAALIRAGCVREAVCPVAWLRDCTAAATVNSGSFIQPVAAVNGRKLAQHAALFQPLWQALQNREGVPCP
ncbi:MAG: aminotransferase class IV [Mariprofundaceae bacterium]|nr:aminotransferase class IV [Mariprofundaceae bacterium]